MTKKIPLEIPLETEEAQRRKIVSRLARIEGQIRAIQGMILDNCSCEQVALQLTAARRALDRAFYEMIICSLNNHIESSDAIEDVRASTKELTRLLAKFG